jgi:hypothetical protein
VQPGEAYTVDGLTAADANEQDAAATLAKPGHKPRSPSTGGDARTAWEEAERELAERQAEREHIHRERVVRELTVQAEALTEAVKAAQQLGSGAPAPATKRSGRREGAGARSAPAGARGGVEAAGSANGSFDAFEEPPISGPAGARETLHEEAGGGVEAPLRYDALFAGRQDDTAAELEETSPRRRRASAGRAAAAGNRKQRQRPAPLALWAHRDHHAGGRRSHQGDMPGAPHPGRTVAVNDLHALLKELNIPPALAEIGYAAGCRIGRVRVRRRPGPRPVEKNAPVVILSRRALERLRPVAVRRSPPEAAVARG